MDTVKIFNSPMDKEPSKVMEREEAVKWFLTGIMCSEGSEQNRYSNCLANIMCGAKEVYLYE